VYTVTAQTVQRRFYSLPETAQVLGVGRSSLERGWRSGSVPTVKIGGRRVVPVAWVDQLTNEAMQNFIVETSELGKGV